MTYVALNGLIMPLEEAHISPEDRGFRFGDGVFETIRITRDRPYLLDEHLQRLQEGLDALGIDQSLQHLPLIGAKLVEKNKVTEGVLRICISRGSGSRGYLPIGEQSPTVYITALSMPDEELTPRKLIVSQYRRLSPAILPTHVKHANGLNSVLARLEAEKAGMDEALMLSENGCVSEASSANIFWQKGGAIYTPSLSTGCLNGIMRQRFMAFFDIIECEAPLDALLTADAAILTNSAYYLVPVASITGNRLAHSDQLYHTWRIRLEDDIRQSFAK